MPASVALQRSFEMGRTLGVEESIAGYVRSMNRAENPALVRCRERTAALGRDAAMQISPEQGAFLQLLVKLVDARDAIEIGVFTGYSATATALAMQDAHGDGARLIACDVSPDYMAEALVTFEEAGVSSIVEPRIGPALRTLDDLHEADEAHGFDLAFVDADKTGYAAYYEKLLPLMRRGGLIAFDNVLWSGDVADPAKTDADTQALRAIAAKVRDDDRVDAAFTTIGDGLLIARKR